MHPNFEALPHYLLSQLSESQKHSTHVATRVISLGDTIRDQHEYHLGLYQELHHFFESKNQTSFIALLTYARGWYFLLGTTTLVLYNGNPVSDFSAHNLSCVRYVLQKTISQLQMHGLSTQLCCQDARYYHNDPSGLLNALWQFHQWAGNKHATLCEQRMLAHVCQETRATIVPCQSIQKAHRHPARS